mmetsp:Transcript_9897/g.14766  ORF Transcript_9897/g.14766 Transcript_9897/m.14766 type:complete len:1209 (+) Transcript_9897:193-3819(+)|eukprot:CAMPEP_0203677648 /NCGR_PEP_ID=MMETSP0090-20130426/28983_1 /ASSEMBLY_ACC=CAM_ASM_001088 /TAXON_ID=426623 /ORGANISM="Chaetoceros affinis, Strain CCMP159" /LENGTH=1208 /DNA_ID=CAMNT_0050544603 /DNA_START=111 /DNA_END=3737 /DNA_ORIENTATION=-
MAWSDEDLSLGSTLSNIDEESGIEYGEEESSLEEPTTATTTIKMKEDDYIPDSLKDFIAEADAALEECLNGENQLNLVQVGLGGDANTNVAADGHTNAMVGTGSVSKAAAATAASFAMGTTVPESYMDGIENDPAAQQRHNSNNNTNSVNVNAHDDILEDNEDDVGISFASTATPTPNTSFLQVSPTTSVPSDVRGGGAFDTDNGSACRPNPVHHYGTESAVKRIALNDDPGVCPDHGDSCICHLKVERRLEDYLLSKNGQGGNGDGGVSQCMEVPGQQQQGFLELGREMVADESFSSPTSTVAKQLRYGGSSSGEKVNFDADVDGDGDISMDVDDDDNENAENFLPNGNNSNNEASVPATATATNSMAFTTTDDDDDDSFFPNTDSLDIPNCDTMKQSNVSRDAAKTTVAPKTTTAPTRAKPKPKATNVPNKAVTIKKAQQKSIMKPGIIASIEKKKKLASSAAAAAAGTKPRVTRGGGRRVKTVPQSPALHTKKLRGERRYSGVGSAQSKAAVAAPSTSTSVTSSSSSGANEKSHSTTTGRRTSTSTSTVPKGPNLRTQKLHGDRQYSAVGFRDEKKEMDHSAAATAAPAGVVDGPAKTIDYKKKALTVPKSPHLNSSAKLGERKYSVVGTREVKEVNNEAADQKEIDYKKKALTVPKSPHLTSTAKLGDRKYSAVGIRGEDMMEVIHENRSTNKVVVDYKKKALTVPKAPKLISSEKLGDRKYSAVGVREEKMNEVKEEKEEGPKINYKTKALTVPKAPKLFSSEKLGDRKYSALGTRQKKTGEVVEAANTKIDWKNRKPTVPKGPSLSTATRPQREKKSKHAQTSEEKEKQAFKALPIMTGILEHKTVGIPKVQKKATTVPKPFRLQTDERIPDNKPQKTKKEDDNSQQPTTFRARAVPNFSRLQSNMQRPRVVKKTKPQPFQLKTDEIALSPRNVRISKASKDIKESLPSTTQPPKKRVITTPKPFNFTQVVRVSSPSKQRPDSNSKPFAVERVKSTKPPTTPKPFAFSSPPKKSPKPELPKDLVQFMSPTKKRKVTVPKPFRLSTATTRTKKLPAPPSTNASRTTSKRATKKVVKPPAPPQRVKKNPTKLKPFNLSSTNIKSPERKKASTDQSKVHPMPASPTRISNQEALLEDGEENVPTPTSVASTNDTKNRNDDCPVAFRRKLLLRSTRSKSRTDRGEQAQMIVNELEELSAMVSQAVI